MAVDMMAELKDKRIRRQIKKEFGRLRHAPKKIGKPLSGDLAGLWTTRAAAQRYRIVYYIDGDDLYVYVVGVGIRKEGDKKDVYAQLHKMLGKIEDSLPEH